MTTDRAATPREHKATAPTSVTCFVLTVSDTKTPATDTSGAVIRELLTAAGHRVAGSAIVRDEPADVARLVRDACADPAVQVVILTGGTGITSRDSTFEAVEALLDKRLPGFGELFRMLSFQEIGPAAVLSRAVAGTAAGKVVYVLPGSSGAVRLALERLILPEVAHVVGQLRRADAAPSGHEKHHRK
jgi:molybdopterin adenylyltransferase